MRLEKAKNEKGRKATKVVAAMTRITSKPFSINVNWFVIMTNTRKFAASAKAMMQSSAKTEREDMRTMAALRPALDRL